jgi:hypothetical protein
MERGIFVQRAMNSRVIIIGSILAQDPTLSFPKIISAHSDDAIRTELVWQ